MSKATIVLEAQSGQIRNATNDLRQLELQGQRAEKSGKSLTGVYKTLAGVFATLGAARFIQSIISATVEQERVTAQLEQTLRSTGRYTPELSKNMQDYAAELQKVTTFGDEAIIGAQALLLTFTQIGEDTMPQATEAVANVAIAMGTDLKSAALQVGKALNDPVRGLNALSRSGIQFSDAQRDLIKDLVETNRVAEAQTVILGELETQFGGSARAARNTLGGAISSLKNAFGDLLEGQGGSLTELTGSINSLTELLNDPQTKESFASLTNGALGFTKALVDGVVAIDSFGKGLGVLLGRAVAGENTPFRRIQAQIDELEPRLKRLAQELQKSRVLRINPFQSTEELTREYDGVLRQIQSLEKLRQRIIDGPQIKAEDVIAPELNEELKEAVIATGKLSDSFVDLQNSLVSQIIAMQEGEETAERYQIMQKLGVDATEEEIAAIDTLLGRLNELRAKREADRQAEQAAREKQRFQAGEERTGEDFGRLQGQLAISTSDDPEIVRIEQQLADRLALIDEYRMTAQANQLAADEAEIAAFEEVERQKTEIAKREAEARQATQLQQLDATASFFGDVAQLAKASGEEGFAIYKAAAIAQAVIGTYSSAVKAYESLAGIPVVGPVLGAAAAATAVAFGLQQVAAIRAQQPPGRALGGTVYRNQSYMVGERGPELFTPNSGGGNITPFNQLMDTARNNEPQQAQPVNINFSISANDSRGFDELLVKRRDLVYNMVQKALNDQGRRL